MSERIDATFVDGVFRPEVPVNIANGERVSIDIDAQSACADDLVDVRDLLDVAFIESCRASTVAAPSLEEARTMLGAFHGSLADYIAQERDES